MESRASEVPSNKYGVGLLAGIDQIAIAMPSPRMSRQEALDHAAWLVAVADPQGTRFPAVLEAVRKR